MTQSTKIRILIGVVILAAGIALVYRNNYLVPVRGHS